MNIVQQHERVRFWVDVVSSTRFESEDIDNALNVAIDNKTRESYDQNRQTNKSDAFQRVQRIRDELGPLVKPLLSGSGLTLGLDGDNSKLTITDEKYGWLLSLKIQDSDDNWHPVYPMTFDRKNINNRNPFRRIRKIPQSKSYYYEDQGNIIIEHALGVLSNAELYNLNIPTIVNYGIETGPSHTFSNGDIVLCTSEVNYNDDIYKIGDKIIFGLPGEFHSIKSGTVVYDFIETELRNTVHEEITRRAAINLLITAKENPQAQLLKQDIMSS